MKFAAIITTFFIISQSDCQHLYDVTSEICCGGSVHPEPVNSTGFRCCGSKLLSTHVGQCCGADQIVPYPPDVKDDFFNWGCCHSLKTDEVTLFNFRSQLCCSGVVHEVGSNFSIGCCGEKTFAYTKELCCDNVIHEIDHRGELGCCGKKIFNFTTEICCSHLPNVTIEDRLNSNINDKIEFQLQTIPVEEQQKFQHGCCGLSIYNFRQELCCDGVKFPLPNGTSFENAGCCGTKMITDWTTQICCEGEIMSRSGADEFCCGNRLYNVSKQICCGEKIFSTEVDVSCCWEAEELYHPKTEVCCGDKVIKTNSSSSRCCMKRNRRKTLPHRPIG